MSDRCAPLPSLPPIAGRFDVVQSDVTPMLLRTNSRDGQEEDYDRNLIFSG